MPVVSCATRGVPDVVQDGVTGLLAPQIDARALARCVRALLVDPARREAMGVAAADFVGRARSLQQAAQELGRALDEVCQWRREGAALAVPAP
jgi:glycosyltransferase involved in cell wall biosynthesis